MKVLVKLFIGLLCSLLIIVGGFSLIQPLLYGQYYQTMETEFKVEGLKDGFIPQGMTYVKEYDAWLYTGYMKDHSCSRLYVLQDGEYRYIELYDEEGVYDGHAGGISYGNDIVYIASGGSNETNRVYMFSLHDVLNKNTDKIVMDQHFHPYSKASYCYVKDNMLWVGEFEDGGKYLTDESHHVNMNRAIVSGYEINEFGLVDEKVDCVLSTGARVQGMAMDENGRIALSLSYGFVSSHLQYYFELETQEVYTYTIENEEVPMYILDNATLIQDIKAPQMSEGIVFKDGRLYVLYESASLKYYFGILTKGRYVHSYQF